MNKLPRLQRLLRNPIIPVFIFTLILSGCSDSGDFSGAGSLNEPRHGHTATILGPERVLIAFGLTKTDPLATMALFDAAQNGFKKLPAPGIRPRGWHRAVKLSGGNVLITGGWTHSNIALREAAIIRPEGGGAIKLKMRLGRYDHTATLLEDGAVLLTGGNDGKRALRQMEIYLPKENTFELLPQPMFVSRQQHTATRLPGGRVLIAGGGQGLGARYAEIFDPATRRTHLAPRAMGVSRNRHTATALRNGHVLLAGGLGPNGALRSAEIFDPAASTFTPLKKKMSAPRQQHTATLLPDGRVLILGGWGKGITLASGEMYDPNLKCFVPLASSLRYARRLHTATLLGNQRVLIAGGASDKEVLARTEIFNIPPGEKSSKKCGQPE